MGGFPIYDPMSGFRAGLTSASQFAQSIQQQREKAMLEPYIVPGAEAKLAQQAAQTKYLGAQTTKALAQAESPMGGASLTGPAGEAMSTMAYHKTYGDNPYAMSVLKNAQDRKVAMANARYFTTIPGAERQQMFAIFKAHNIDPLAAIDLIKTGKAKSVQDVLNMKFAADQLHLKQSAGVSSQIQAQQIGAPSISAPGAPQAPISAPGSLTQGIAQAQQPATQQIPAQPTAVQPTPAETVPPTSGQAVTPQHIMGALTQAAPGAPTWQTTQGMYAPQAGTLEKAQKQASSAAGLKYIGDYIAKNIKYGGVIAKGTRPWYYDAISGDPNREQKAARFYLAHMVKPELALARISQLGGQASARAIAAIAPTILGSIDPDIGLAPPQIQQIVQQGANDLLTGMASVMTQQVLSPRPTFVPEGAKPLSQIAIVPGASQQQQGIVMMKTPDGQIWHVPANKVAAAIKMKAVRI